MPDGKQKEKRGRVDDKVGTRDHEKEIAEEREERKKGEKNITGRGKKEKRRRRKVANRLPATNSK